MFRLLAVLVVLAALIFEGIICGVWTQRWVPVASLEALVSASQLPEVVGEWDGKDQVVPPAIVQGAQAAAITRRLYVNRRTGNVASVMLISGRSGPISVHTPEVCFPSNGYNPVGQRKRIAMSRDGRAQFWHLDFKKADAGSMPCSVYYAWNDGDHWDAADNPRITYSNRKTLFKLYVVCERNSDGGSDLDESTRDLIDALLPLLKPSM